MALGLTTADVEARCLYVHVNEGASIAGGTAPNAADVASRTLYLAVNEGIPGHPVGGETLGADDVLARTLYLFVNEGHGQTPADVAGRGLYLAVSETADELFPWIERIRPSEQYVGGQVEIYGDGFGATQGAEGSSIRLGVYDPGAPGPGLVMGVVSWSTRSPNLYPANGDGSGANPPLTLPAIVATVPTDAESGMLSVEETT